MSFPSNSQSKWHSLPHQQGTLLLVVVGLASLMAVLATTVMLQVRSDSQSTRLVFQDAQARVSLTNALFFICESSRIGYLDKNGQPTEARGWVDVRTGDPGPLGPSIDTQGPEKLGWSDGGAWPAPGSVYRGDLHAVVRPPGAIDPHFAPNPVQIPDTFPSDGGKANATAMEGWVSRSKVTGVSWGDQHAKHWYDTYTNAWNSSDSWGMFTTRPRASTWDTFTKGDTTPVANTQGLTWFRVYRETRDDHDGDGSPWYDTVDFTDGTANGYHDAGIFIVTVAAGATQGYRFWDNNSDFLGGDDRGIPSGSYSSVLEPETALASSRFPNESVFRALRAQERILWYRVRWTPRTGGRYNPMSTAKGYWSQSKDKFGQRIDRVDNTASNGALMRTIRNQVVNPGRDSNADGSYSPDALNFAVHQGGSIAWIQRLEREPPKW